MLVLLKLVSFAIWFIIMLFIIGAGSQHRRSQVQNLGSYLFDKGEYRSKFRRREKV